jgi:inosose dehydratase
MSIKIGCQSYTWQMSGGKYDGRLDHIIAVTANAGFLGIEPETRFLGKLADPVLLTDTLAQHNVELPALTLVEDWLLPKETKPERDRAEQCFEMLRHFPDTILNLCQMPGADRNHLEERQQNLLHCVNAIAERACDYGIKVGYHPNSPSGSVYRTEQDYKILLNGLDERFIGFIADAGHIAKGGMDPLSIVKEYFARLNHIHYKDMDKDGQWASMGQGCIDDKAITQFLVDAGFNGWIVVEDECDLAMTDPDGVTMADGRYVKDNLLPIVQTG